MIGNFWGKDFALSRGGNRLIMRGLGEIWGDRGFWEGFGCGGGVDRSGDWVGKITYFPPIEPGLKIFNPGLNSLILN